MTATCLCVSSRYRSIAFCHHREHIHMMNCSTFRCLLWAKSFRVLSFLISSVSVVVIVKNCLSLSHTAMSPSVGCSYFVYHSNCIINNDNWNISKVNKTRFAFFPQKASIFYFFSTDSSAQLHIFLSFLRNQKLLFEDVMN